MDPESLQPAGGETEAQPHEIETLPPVEPQPEQPEESRGWTYLDAGVVIGFAVAAQIMVYLLGLLVMFAVETARGRPFSHTAAITHVSFVLPVQMAWWGLVFWIVYRVVRARDPRPFAQAIGWIRPAASPATYLAGGVVLAFSVAGLSKLLPMPRQKMPMEELFRDPTSAFLLAAFGVLIAPVIEELLFRGFFFPVVERSHGALAAVFATAAIFSLVHAQQYGGAWQNLILLGYVGVVFGAVRAVSGSLVPSTLIHASYNFTLFAGLFVATNRFQNLSL